MAGTMSEADFLPFCMLHSPLFTFHYPAACQQMISILSIMKSVFQGYALLFTGVAIGFICSLFLLQSPLIAQTEDLDTSPAYGLVTAEFFSGNREVVMQQFAIDVEAQLKNGWECHGPPVLEKTGSDLQPMIIVQALVK